MDFWIGFFAGVIVFAAISLITTTTPDRASQNLKAWAALVTRASR